MSNTIETDRLLRWPEVRNIVDISRYSARALELQGLFPKRVSLGGPRAVAWSERELLAWVQARLAARSDPRAEAAAKARRTPSKWRQVADQVA